MTDTTATNREIADVKTAHATRYAGQLCKHFAHKVPSEYDAATASGSVSFPFGTLRARAEGEVLVLDVEAAPDVMERLKDVAASHLVRFAFREELKIDWRAA